MPTGNAATSTRDEIAWMLLLLVLPGIGLVIHVLGRSLVQLDQDWRASEELDVGGAEDAQRSRAADPHEADHEAEQRAEHDADDGELDGGEQSQEQHVEVLDDYAQ